MDRQMDVQKDKHIDRQFYLCQTMAACLGLAIMSPHWFVSRAPDPFRAEKFILIYFTSSFAPSLQPKRDNGKSTSSIESFLKLKRYYKKIILLNLFFGKIKPMIKKQEGRFHISPIPLICSCLTKKIRGLGGFFFFFLKARLLILFILKL